FVGAFVFGAILLAGIIAFMLNGYLSKTLESELINTSRMIARSIEEPVAENLYVRDVQALKDLVEKYKYFENVDYLIIEDFERNVVEHTFMEDIPEEIKNANSIDDLDEEGAYNTIIASNSALGIEYVDIIIPVKEGELGFIRIGTDKNYIDSKVLTTIYYTISVIGILTGIWMIIGILIVNFQISHPIKFLAEMAEKISLGDFNTPIKIKSKNEIGELAEAIERMRESLKAAIDRLKKRQMRKI
ncbi:MAG: HAMP domain-containing protein, partial [Calditrichia bacterium]|nr:HAMP domain-containing protein [Calditrichia bacterium]